MATTTSAHYCFDMAHHKRRRPKNRRGGCLFCKYYKANHARLEHRDPPSARRRMQDGEPEAS